ncbi:MAG: hypothetical protein ACJATI_002926 [Halioglobus sp.]|jgi:hypothetical protein
MDEIKYYNSINVLKGNVLGRDVNIGTYVANSLSALFDINTIAYLDLQRIQNKLHDILSGNFKYEYEWSGMRCCFESNAEFTTIEDSVFDSKKEDVKTDMINELIINRIEYLNTLNEEIVLKKIKCGFDKIKLKPSDHIIEGFRYKIELTNETLFFLLLEEDFDLSTEEFISTIKINDSLFRKDSLE